MTIDNNSEQPAPLEFEPPLASPTRLRYMGTPALIAAGFVVPGHREPTGKRLLEALTPTVETNLHRHLATATDWMPHDYIPWDRARNFGRLGGKDWEEDDSTISPEAQVALTVNLMTEDNLPSYHREIATQFSRDGAWGQWVGRWTAEEGRHGIALRDYLVVTRGVDPVALEVERMAHMTAGYDSGERNSLETAVYVSFQELATRISHRNTGAAAGEPIAEALMQRIAADENLHMVFYRNIVSAAFDEAPNQTMQAVAKEVINFEMPGANMKNYRRRAVTIAKAGIYDLPQHHDKVIMPVLRYWKVFEREDFGPEGEQARLELAEFLVGLKRQAETFSDQRAAWRARMAK